MYACPRAILLDLDGTLADSLPALRLAYRNFLEQFHVAATDAEFESINGPPLIEVVRKLKVTHRLKDHEDALVANYFAAVDRAYTDVTPCLGASDLLQKAKANQCAIGLVTSNSTRRARTWLDAVAFSHWIDFIVSADEVQHGKPDPEPYLLAATRACCPSSTIVAVEDSLQGAQSAIAAGLKTYVLTGGLNQKRDEWPRGAQPIESLKFLSEQLW